MTRECGSRLDIPNKRWLDNLFSDSKKEYISIMDISKLGISPWRKIWKYVWITIEHTLSRSSRHCFTMFFDRLDAGKKVKENYSNLHDNDKNYVKFSIEENWEVQIWWAHLEWWESNGGENISLRWVKNDSEVKPSDFILDFLMMYMRERWEYTYFKTGSIRKPFFAKLLQKHWFDAYIDDILVIIASKKEIWEEVFNIETKISILEKEINELRNVIITQTEVGAEARWERIRRKGTLGLSESVSKKMRIEWEIWEKEDKLSELRWKIQDISECLEKKIPIVKWYWVRKDGNNFRQPNFLGNGVEKWFLPLSVDHELPDNREDAIPLQTSYYYTGSADKKIARTRGNVLWVISEILSGKH